MPCSFPWRGLGHRIRFLGRGQRWLWSCAILSIHLRTSPALFNLIIRIQRKLITGHRLEFTANFLLFNLVVMELRILHKYFLGCSTCFSRPATQLREEQLIPASTRNLGLINCLPGSSWASVAIQQLWHGSCTE